MTCVYKAGVACSSVVAAVLLRKLMAKSAPHLLAVEPQQRGENCHTKQLSVSPLYTRHLLFQLGFRYRASRGGSGRNALVSAGNWCKSITGGTRAAH